MKRVLRVRSVTSRHWQSATNVQKVRCKLALKVSVVISLPFTQKKLFKRGPEIVGKLDLRFKRFSTCIIIFSLNLVLARLGWFFGLRMCWFGVLYFMSGFIFVSLLFQDTTVRCQMPPNAHYVKRVHTRIAKDSYCAMCALLVKFASMNYHRLYVFIVQYNTIQYDTIQYNTIQYNTIQYNTLFIVGKTLSYQLRYIMFLPKNYLSFEFGKYCGVRYLSLLIIANSIIGRGGGHIFMYGTINFF